MASRARAAVRSQRWRYALYQGRAKWPDARTTVRGGTADKQRMAIGVDGQLRCLRWQRLDTSIRNRRSIRRLRRYLPGVQRHRTRRRTRAGGVMQTYKNKTFDQLHREYADKYHLRWLYANQAARNVAERLKIDYTTEGTRMLMTAIVAE